MLRSNVFKGNKEISTEQIESIISQKPNRSFLFPGFMPWLYLYESGKKKHTPAQYTSTIEKAKITFDSLAKQSKELPENIEKARKKRDKIVQKQTRLLDEGNWKMRSGEAPVLFSLDQCQENAKKIQDFYRKRGFMDAWVNYRADTLFLKGIKVAYLIQENSPTVFRKVNYLVQDPKIDSILSSRSKDAVVRQGEIFSEDNIKAEQLRIEQVLRNNGYYYFNKGYVTPFVNDTIPKLDSLRLFDALFIVKNPRQNELHPEVKIGSIDFVIDSRTANTGQGKVLADSSSVTYFKGVKFIYNGLHRYSTKILYAKLMFQPGDVYAYQKQLETQRLIYNLDQFRFATIAYDSTNTNHQLLNTTIYAVPLDKYQLTAESGLNVFQGLPGPFSNLTLKARNILKRCDIFENTFRFGYEGQAGVLSSQQAFRSLEMNLNSTFNFPELLLPTRLRYKFSQANPRTQVGVGFGYISRYEYERTNMKLGLNYTWQKGSNRFFNVSLFDINLLNTINIKPEFSKFLDSLQLRGNNLVRSFGQSFVSSVSMGYTFNSNPLGKIQKGKYFRLFIESGGTLSSIFGEKQLSWLDGVLGNTLKYYQYLRLNTDFRLYHPVGIRRKNLLVFRANVGLAYSLNSDGVLPYEKYFFAGGSNSLRAWRPRRLGPGTYKAVENGTELDFERPGNLLLESNAEFRFKIIRLAGDINGAFFIDVGNIWTTNYALSASATQHTNFKFDSFFREIALNTGFGIRYDFSFFVFRLDAAVKVFDPSREVGSRYVLPEFGFNKLGSGTNPIVLNIAIGYPF